MPRETVYGQQHTLICEDTQGADGEALMKPMVPVVEVMWSREAEYVQVVTKATDAHGGRWAGSYESELPTVTTWTTEVEAQPLDTHFTDGMYVDLDRAAINKLIRDLRRARDQAFGRDE